MAEAVVDTVVIVEVEVVSAMPTREVSAPVAMVADFLTMVVEEVDAVATEEVDALTLEIAVVVVAVDVVVDTKYKSVLQSRFV